MAVRRVCAFAVARTGPAVAGGLALDAEADFKSDEKDAACEVAVDADADFVVEVRDFEAT